MESKTLPAGKPKRKHPSPQQEAAVSILQTAGYLRRFCGSVFEQHDITPQQYNVLRILRGAGSQGLPTLDIADRMIEQTPGITRLLDRLEAKKLVSRERPLGDRRQVICYVTKEGLNLLNKLDAPVREKANEALRVLNEAETKELIRLLAQVRERR